MRVIIIFALIMVASQVTESSPTIAEYIRVMRRLVIVPNSLREVTPMVFDYRQGNFNRGFFETFHGTKGQMMIDMYGKGLSREELRKHGML